MKIGQKSYPNKKVYQFIYRISANATLPWGCIFQNGFWGEVQFKKSLKKWTCQQKKWGSIREKPQKQDFLITWGYIQDWGCIGADMVLTF